ncbi:MAG: GNAT family N-acetyltransferase [Bacilli bacterium]|nr:GNAT family N-acetyltransferase [Bacilli bacterium]
MENIEKRLYYYELLMTYDDTSNYIEYNLPEGFHFEYYQDGDIDNWIDIHLSSKEFTSRKRAKQYFYDFYHHFINELGKRCIFIVDSKTNEKVATATISLLEEKEGEYEAAVDWVAIKEEYQGKKLAKPLISRFIKLANELGHKKIILHTQTHTWLAAKIYLDLGFNPYQIEENLKGWQILKTITNHQKLQNIEKVKEEDMYSKTACKIYEELKKIYIDNFNYEIWYKNNRNDVYVYKDKLTYEYKYYEKDEDIILELIKEDN